MRWRDDFGGDAIATGALQNVLRRSRAEFWHTTPSSLPRARFDSRSGRRQACGPLQGMEEVS